MLLPGVAATGVAVLLSLAVHRLVPALGPAVVAVIAGAALANLAALGGPPGFMARLRPGLGFVARRVLRIAIVLLGLQIAVPQVLALGWPTVVVVVASTGVTFGLTPVIGRRLGVSPGTSLLVATGVSVCGAAAIAAMHDGTRAAGHGVPAGHDAGHGVPAGSAAPAAGPRGGTTEDDVAAALSVVVLYGSAAIAVVPLAAAWLEVPDDLLGVWTGAAVHEVAQVAAIGSASGVLATAITVKLGRVLLLAPLVALTTALARAGARPDRQGSGTGTGSGRRPPVMPLFVAGFLAAVAVRGTGLLPSEITGLLADVTGVLMAAALFALGTGIDARKLARGGRVLLLGGIATGLVASVSLAGLLLLG